MTECPYCHESVKEVWEIPSPQYPYADGSSFFGCPDCCEAAERAETNRKHQQERWYRWKHRVSGVLAFPFLVPFLVWERLTERKP